MDVSPKGDTMDSILNEVADHTKRSNEETYEEGDIKFEIQDEPEPEEPKKCLKLRECCHRSFKPLRTKYNPLPQKANILDRLKFSFLCPAHGKVGGFILLLFLFGVWWATLISVTNKESLPGGNLFALLVLLIACWFGGYIITFIKLPPLLGMLLVGIMLRNVPHISIATDILPSWSGGARQIALTVILIRAGLGLDPQALRKLSFVVLRLAFSPCLVETIVDAIASHLLLGLPWVWSFMLGFVIAAVSPAVVVPCLLSLQDRGYGVEKGVPTLVIAAASIDDVLAITGFGVVLGMAFSKGNIVWTFFKGPIEAIVGIVFGVLVGIFLWYIPQKKSKNLLLFRAMLLMGFGLVAIFGSKHHAIEWPGSGPLACLTLAFVAAFQWRKEDWGSEKNPIEDVVGVLWMFFQPLLFGLIGAEIDVTNIQANTIGLGIATLGIGLAARMVTAFLAVFGTELTLREKFFIPFAWLPKATVQAAFGTVAYDNAVEKNDEDAMSLGKEILTIAVLSILITAPIGSALIGIIGPRVLAKKAITQEDKLDNEDDAEANTILNKNKAVSSDVEQMWMTTESESHNTNKSNACFGTSGGQLVNSSKLQESADQRPAGVNGTFSYDKTSRITELNDSLNTKL